MGVALAQSGTGVDADELIRDADTAMYRAKELGRARVEMFDEQMRRRASARLEVQQDLRMALRSSQIRAHYQPVIDLVTQQVTGCEALARWEHPTRGLLGPQAFIEQAEETGLIVPIGAAVLEQACQQVARWNTDRPADDGLTVSVNLSARQLSSPALVDTVAAALACSGLPPQLLCLEITESVVMEDVATSGEVLGRLRALGVRTAVDDFGTGYSSLAYLLSLPVDLLKVDQSFVSALDVGGPGTAIVRAIAALADALGLGVVAEGVETAQQLDVLAGLGIRSGQGYLWGRPVPADEASWSGPDGLAAPRHRSIPVTAGGIATAPTAIPTQHGRRRP